MATKTASSGAAALRYATALIDTAIESKSLDIIEKDLGALEGMISSSADLQRALTSPLFKREEQKKAMTALSDTAQFHTLTKNFLLLLADNRRLALVSGIISAVRADLSRRRGEVKARVQAAFDLTDAQAKALQSSLSEATGKNVTLDVEINKDLIGGMIVTVGSRMVDDSVKRKLERLKQAMKSGANGNTAEAEKAS